MINYQSPDGIGYCRNLLAPAQNPNYLGTANGGQNFSDLINELAAFNPTPAAKEKTLTRG